MKEKVEKPDCCCHRALVSSLYTMLCCRYGNPRKGQDTSHFASREVAMSCALHDALQSAALHRLSHLQRRWFTDRPLPITNPASLIHLSLAR